MKLHLIKLDEDATSPIKRKEFIRVVKVGCNYVSVSSDMQVGFTEDKGQARLINTPTIKFSFADFGDIGDTAQWSEPNTARFEVRFNYYLNWATTQLQPWLPWRLWRIFQGPSHDLLTHVVHELGHVVGMYRNLPNGASQHNPDKWSVMNARPITYKFTKTDLGTLRTVTRPGYVPPVWKPVN